MALIELHTKRITYSKDGVYGNEHADKIKKACFLCFELNGDNQLYEEMIIQDSKFNYKTSLYKIARYLMPGFEILFSQACKDCSGVIIKMFSILQDHLFKKDILEKIVICMNENIPKTINVQNECTIKLSRNKIKSQGIATVENEQNVHNADSVNYKEQSTTDIVLKKPKLQDSSKTVICHICGKSCVNQKSLKAHLNCHIEKQCPYCNKILKSHSHFNKHVKNHKAQRTIKRVNKIFNCPRCSYYGQNKSDLEAHANKVHLKIKPYECEQCSKSFYKKSNLSAHKMIHFNIRPLICEVCGQNFLYKKTLAEHLRLHSGEKIFKCDICQRNFTTQSRRNEHLKRNHSNEFISCLICNKKYTLKKELNNHMKRFHQGISN